MMPYLLLTANMINRDAVLIQRTDNALVEKSDGKLIRGGTRALTRCAIPLAPPPPRTSPIDLPQILRASRAKSFA